MKPFLLFLLNIHHMPSQTGAPHPFPSSLAPGAPRHLGGPHGGLWAPRPQNLGGPHGDPGAPLYPGGPHGALEAPRDTGGPHGAPRNPEDPHEGPQQSGGPHGAPQDPGGPHGAPAVLGAPAPTKERQRQFDLLLLTTLPLGISLQTIEPRCRLHANPNKPL